MGCPCHVGRHSKSLVAGVSFRFDGEGVALGKSVIVCLDGLVPVQVPGHRSLITEKPWGEWTDGFASEAIQNGAFKGLSRANKAQWLKPEIRVACAGVVMKQAHGTAHVAERPESVQRMKARRISPGPSQNQSSAVAPTSTTAKWLSAASSSAVVVRASKRDGAESTSPVASRWPTDEVAKPVARPRARLGLDNARPPFR